MTFREYLAQVWTATATLSALALTTVLLLLAAAAVWSRVRGRRRDTAVLWVVADTTVTMPAYQGRHRPMVSPDETELRAPLRPASADPDFGLSLPGFAVGFRPGPTAEGEGDG